MLQKNYKNMKKFALILSGCGSMDGSEIHESVSAMYAIDRSGASYQVFAPDVPQYAVVNHLNRQAVAGKRNCMEEAARIARGDVRPLQELNVKEFDALVFPGGSGTAKNLFTFGYEGEDFRVREDVADCIRAFHQAGKPIGAMCISPLMLAKVIEGARVTMGQHAPTSALVEKLGGSAVPTHNGEVAVDAENRLFTVPCYMLDARISDIFEDAFALIGKMTENMR